MRRYTLVNEPVGDLYRALLDHGRTHCETALLIEQPSLGLTAHGRAVLDSLQPFLTQREQTAEWPGTRLLDGTAWVHAYSLTAACLEILKEASTGLLGWHQPDLPEDLALLRADGSPWLTTIAHERDAYVDLTSVEEQDLRRALPWLELRRD